MADSNLDTSIAALKTELLNAIPTATVDELVSIARSAKGMNLGEDSSLEQAINTRVNTLASTATSDEVSKLATVIKQFLNPAAITVTNFTSVTGDLIPDTNEAYDLGSTTNRFKDLYISGNTLFLGDTKIQDDGTELKFLDSSDNPRVMKAKEIDLDDGTGERVRMRRNAQGRLAFRNIDNSGNDTGAVSTASTGATVGAYSLMSELPLSGIDAGTQAFVSENNKLFLWTGTGWYNIALVNQSPTPITGVNGSYSLANDGTPTVITAVSTDPEGLPLTWSYQVTSGTLGSTATVAQANNVFTITPSVLEADAGDFTLTFSASDGVNQSVANSSFSLQFQLDWSSASRQTLPLVYGWDATSQGDSIALSEDGNKMVVGNPSTNNNNEGGWTIWTRTGTSWSPTHILYADQYERGYLGKSIAMDATGTRVAVTAGTGSTTGNDLNRAGTVIIYTVSGTTATREDILNQSGTGTHESDILSAQGFASYGGCISMDKLGERIIVGHSLASAYSYTQCGQAYIYRRDGTTWSREHTITGDWSYDHLGNGVVISGDGQTAFVTRGAGDGSNSPPSGPSVKVLGRVGTTWNHQTEFYSPAGNNVSNRFGGRHTGGHPSIACSNDGNILVIGDGAVSSNRGKAWVFTRTGTSWDSGVELTPTNASGTNDFFGTGIAIDDNGTVIFVGKPQASNSQYLEGGEVHAFQKNESGSFVEVNKISNPDDLSSVSGTNGPQEQAKFGETVTVSGDSSTLGIGAPATYYYANGVPTGWYGDHYGRTYVYIP